MTAPEVDPDHLNRIVALANKLGRRPTSNAVIRELKSSGIGVGRSTANKILDALDRTHLEDHWTGPRLKVVPDGQTGPADPESARTGGAPVADQTAQPPRTAPVESDGPTPSVRVDQPTGPAADSAPRSTAGPAPIHPDQTGSDRRTELAESDPESTRTGQSRSAGSALGGDAVQYPTEDLDYPPEQEQTTGPAWTGPSPVQPDRTVDPAIESTPTPRTETTRTGNATIPDRAGESAGPGRTESTPDRPDQDRDHLPQSTGPTMVSAPSPKAQKLLQSARQASEIRAHQTDPDVIALRAEKIRAWTGRLVWTGLILGLLFTAGNVQSFGAQGAAVGSITWWTAWVLDPMVSLVLVGLLLAESVTSRHGVKTGRWMRAAKWFALGATYAMNTWVAWESLDPASILLHSVPPGLVFFATEAITDAWDKITEAVNVAVEQAEKRLGR